MAACTKSAHLFLMPCPPFEPQLAAATRTVCRAFIMEEYVALATEIHPPVVQSSVWNNILSLLSHTREQIAFAYTV